MNSLKGKVTLLLLPPAGAATWSLRVSVRTLAVSFGAWTLLTLWGGIMFARQADYWAMKADNRLMRGKMSVLSEEIDKSKASVERAEETDRKMRELLSLPTRSAIMESAESVAQADGAGGPQPLDRLDLLGGLKQAHPEDPEAIRLRAELVRQESDRALRGFNEILRLLKRQRAQLRATPLGWPAPGRLSSRFGKRVSPIDGEDNEFHPGLDIANEKGTPITATADGVVRQAGWTRGYGRVVIIDHGRGCQTLFGHASQLLVARGQQVRRGDIVARMGSTGRSTGSHLHYEIWVNGRPVNPKGFLKEAPLLTASPLLAQAAGR